MLFVCSEIWGGETATGLAKHTFEMWQYYHILIEIISPRRWLKLKKMEPNVESLVYGLLIVVVYHKPGF